jgi:hypothetical protein
MALFSRRPADPPSDDEGDDATAGALAGAPAGRSEAAPEPEAQPTDPSTTDADAAASVGISVSTYRGLGARTPDAESPTTPSATDGAAFRRPAAQRPSDETVPGLRDNVLLRERLALLPETPTPQDVLDVARQVMQGHLFLRIKGDAQALIAAGKPLPLGSATIGDRKFALAYASGGALAASIRQDGDADTSAMAQPVLVVLRHMLAGTADGLVIDPASRPGRLILPRDVIESLVAGADEQLTLKTLLAGERTDATAAELVEALTRVRVWAAVNRAEEGGPLGIAEGRSEDGSRYLELYSHPIEVVAMGRGDQPAPLTPAQVAAALATDTGLSGVLIDPRGPWARLSRAELAPLIATAS